MPQCRDWERIRVLHRGKRRRGTVAPRGRVHRTHVARRSVTRDFRGSRQQILRPVLPEAAVVEEPKGSRRRVMERRLEEPARAWCLEVSP